MRVERNHGMRRRRFLVRVVLGTGGILGSVSRGTAAADLPPEKVRDMEEKARSFSAKYHVPGLSVAIAREGRIIYTGAFGVAEKNQPLTIHHLFRIASVSKPITSVMIFRLQELGRLKISDTVFGPRGILGSDFGSPPYSPHVDELTLEHFLTHTAGGWQNDGNDPMFSHPRMNHRELITWTLANRPLSHAPGENYAYSNFGFCLLGRVIEKVTGKPYAEAVQETVLKPCGISTMRVGGNSRSERIAREVEYVDQNGSDPYGMNVRRMDSHGGWLATASDLVRFLVRADGFPNPPDILKPGTIQIMTTGSKASAGYAKGWSVNRSNNWWHMGSLPGTTSIMVRTSSQYCWAALASTRDTASKMNGDLDRLMWEMI